MAVWREKKIVRRPISSTSNEAEGNLKRKKKMCESKEGKLNDTDIFGSCENNQGNTKGLQCEKSIRKM